MEIWFILNEEYNEFPVFKVVKPSMYRFGHYIRLATGGGPGDTSFAFDRVGI
ncbi:MAG: hypothetical protein AAF694_17505 [Bacteroidota bacterium]